MHDTAFHIGTLAMNIYADLRTDAILEVGSQSINGSLRESALSSTRYVGLDIEDGEGVDLLLEPGKPFPVVESSFDLVMASSVFEHDPCFWITFLEMCRATKDGGYIYINAPSNGVVHRYPQDNWRFYPDSGKALVTWAASQGSPVMLVESFVAKRDRDIWNDFVAVFRKGPIKKTLPKVFLHENVPCTDVITWKSKEIIHPSEEPEDMVLLREAEKRASVVAEDLTRTVGERDYLIAEAHELRARLKTVEDERQRQLAEAQEAKTNLGLRESELRQRQEEIEQNRLEIVRLRSELSAEKQRVEGEVKLKEQAESALVSTRATYECEQAAWESQSKSLKLELEQVRAQHLAAEAALGRSRAANEEAQSRLRDRFEEVAKLTKLLAKSEAAERQAQEKVDWLSATSSVLVNGSTTLRGRLLTLLPASFEARRQRRLLKRKGLFNAESYLEKNADVVSDGMDPLRHYIVHGLDEGRQF